MNKPIPTYSGIFRVPETATHIQIGSHLIEIAGVIDSATEIIIPRPNSRIDWRITPAGEEWLAANLAEPAAAPAADCGCGKRRKVKVKGV